jgi:hypothetical protein
MIKEGAVPVPSTTPALRAIRKYYPIEMVSQVRVSHNGWVNPPMSVEHFLRAKKD